MFCNSEENTYLCTPQSLGGGIGRRAGLKIQYPLKMYGFESHPRHEKEQRNRCSFSLFHNVQKHFAGFGEGFGEGMVSEPGVDFGLALGEAFAEAALGQGVDLAAGEEI